MFKTKSAEVIAKMTEEENAKYYAELLDFQAKSIEELIASKAKDGAKSDEIEKQIKELQSANITAMKSSLEVQGSALAKLQKEVESKSTDLPMGFESQINNFIEKNIDKIAEMKSAGAGMIEFEVKAVGSMASGSASLPVAAPALQGTQVAPASNVNLRETFIDSVVTSFTTNQASYAYTESTPKDGDYSFVAEGALKPQTDFKIETRYAAPVKIAAHMILTDESVRDIQGMQSIATDYLRKKHDLKRQNGILFGDGTGANPKGATVYGRAFVAGTMATAVVNPNIMDVVNACITDIYSTTNYTDEMPYIANMAMVNPTDFFLHWVSAKDENGLPLYPSASLAQQVTIGGITIKPESSIPTGKIFVADMSKYIVTSYESYNVKIGWINDQMITNQFTMVGESRFHAFVKNLDEQAFIYDDIATIKTAITKP